jgi:ATP-dependent helicase/nuclease subunit B
MTTTLLQATVGAGKTEAALERLSNLINDDTRPFARAWVLLATKRQEVTFRQRLIDLQDGRAVYFNVEFFNFYELNTRLLHLAANPQRRINEAARLGLLRKILSDLLHDQQLPTFAPIAQTSGFLRVMADLIYEMKQNRVYPEVFQKAAETRKDYELALIYDTYQNRLIQHRLVDREGEAWLALEAVEQNPQLATSVDLLLVDGYDQFTPVQADLLARLSLAIADLVITLTKAPGDRDEDAQKLIGRRFKEAESRLAQTHKAIAAPIHFQTLTDPKVEKHPDLIGLAQNIFSQKPKLEANGAIQLIEAPEPLQEVAAVLREVKQSLLDGVQPDEILIALRDWPRYHNYIEMYARLYQLPLLLHYGQPLHQNPALTVLMNILALPGKNPDLITSFRRRDVLDILRSPYVNVSGFSDEIIDLLDKVSQKMQVLGGQKNWFDAIRDAAKDPADFNFEDEEAGQKVLTTQQESDLSLALQDFFNHIMPPERATHQYYVEWLETLIGQDTLENPDDPLDELQPHKPYTLNIPRCIRSVAGDSTMERIINRDVTAINQFKDLLRGMLSTQELLRTALGDESTSISWRGFFDDIQAGVKNTTPIQHNPIRSGRVLVTTATEARGLPHDYVYILGLSEGLFPAEQAEDPIYLDSERIRLREKGVLLQTQAERADDDGIFYELISLPRKNLTLSRPHVREGKQWVESHLWRMTRAVFSNLQATKIGIGEVVPPQDVTSLEEAVLAIADAMSGANRDDKQMIVPIYQWLMQAHGDYWQHIQAGRDTELSRMSRKAHDSYSGQIQHPDLIEIIADKLDDNFVWSATRLNAFGTCPYRFFAAYLLALQEVKEPEEGMDQLQLGSLNHEILEKTYKEIKHDNLRIVPDNMEIALEILEEIAAKSFKDAPHKHHFRASALWKEQQSVILRRLWMLVKRDFSDDSPLNKLGSERRPFALEMRFGFGDNLRIPVGDSSIRVRGVIDRIDISDGKLILVDYKSGTTKINPVEMAEGRNFQMMVYLMALNEQIKQNGWKYRIAGGTFWHIRDQETSKIMEIKTGLETVNEITDAQVHLTRYFEQMRSGNFAVQPSKPGDNRCTSYCEFYQLCRLSNTDQYKE